MTSEQRKRWWQAAAAVVLGGGVLAGWHGYKSATAQPVAPVAAVPLPQNPQWVIHAGPVEPPRVSEVARLDPAVAPASASLPALPALPVPPAAPVLPLVPAAPPPLPPLPVEPASGPRAPDAGLLPLDKKDLPKLPEPPKPLDLLPPVAPPLPLTTEPPKAPPIAPPAPLAPPAKPVDPIQIAPPAKPESGLNPPKIGNTLNSMVAPLAPPTAPAAPGAREVPGTTVERGKVPETVYGSSEKYAFPLPSARPVPPPTPQPSIDTMLNTTRTAVALLGGALLAAEAAAVPALPPVKPPVPAVPVRADDPDVKKLKEDLTEANKKIAGLEKDIEKLRELVLGKKDDRGFPIPSDPGAVARIKELQDTIERLTKELNALKTQTALKPNVQQPPAPLPEAKPRGIVKVVNEYPIEISMVINEKSYRVAPSTKVEVEVPAGEFSYQLLQAGVAATRSVIKDKETVTLRIK